MCINQPVPNHTFKDTYQSVTALTEYSLNSDKYTLTRCLLQLKKLGVMPPEQPLPLKCYRIYQIMWANNGDTISKQYAGTAALKVPQHQSPLVFATDNSREVWETLAQSVAEKVPKSSHQNNKKKCGIKTSWPHFSPWILNEVARLDSCVWSCCRHGYALHIRSNLCLCDFYHCLFDVQSFWWHIPWKECLECNSLNCYREISPGLGRGNWQV